MASRLLFADEFNSFDAYSKTDAWHTAYHWGPNAVINGEKGYYVDTENAGTTGPAGAVNPFSVSNGILSITSAPKAGLPNGQTYTSGVISSMGTFDRVYGYYEMRADMPGGKGFWPAFWLMPSDKVSPPELDIMEYSSRLPNEYVTTLHSNAGGTYKMSQEFQQGLPDLSQGYHTYAVDWQADKITWYYDNQAVYSVATPADMHKPMYMLVNQAVSGGPWIGPADGSTQKFNVDYVRVYDTKPTGTVTTPPPAPTPTPTPSTGNAPATVVVNAQGNPAGGVNAHFNVLIDGVKIGEGTAGTTAKDYTFTSSVAANAAHKVQVQFDNNADINGEDRNLIVNKITVNGTAVAPNATSVSYDRGGLDGVDVLAGQSVMYWDGTLVASLPAATFPAAATTPPAPTPTPTPTAGASTIVVNASGNPAGGVNAHFNVLVDGVKVGEGTAGTTAKDYAFTANVAANTAHKVQVQFDNNADINGEDRNLIVNKVTINGNAVLPTSSSVVYDRGALDGADVLAGQSTMYWDGTLVTSAPPSFFPGSTTTPAPAPTPTSGSSSIIVNASGSPAGGVNAHFNLLIDGKKVGEGTAGTTAKDFVFNTTATLNAGHKVQVQFDNDAYISGQDRNLVVNKITINGKAVLPTASIVSYDKGALDGKDVVAGQSGLWWNGTLVVNADKSYFPAPTAAAAQADAPLETWLQLNAQAPSAAQAAEQQSFGLDSLTTHETGVLPDLHTDTVDAHTIH